MGATERVARGLGAVTKRRGLLAGAAEPLAGGVAKLAGSQRAEAGMRA